MRTTKDKSAAILFTMTSPQPPVQPSPLTFIDTNNPLCGPCPARLDIGVIQHPVDGPMGVVTIRTASTTMTVVMGADDLQGWGDSLKELANQMGGAKKSLLVAGPGDAAALKQSLSHPTRLWQAVDMFDVPLLRRGYDEWYCPNKCGAADRTPALPPDSTRYHVCPKLHGLNAPLIRVGTDCKVEAVQREDYINTETQTKGDDGKFYMAVNTERADGSNDRLVHPGVARVRFS